jgi:ubiquinone/menaquinone biosynthesis C-methylase UbiE
VSRHVPAEFDTYGGNYDEKVNASISFSGLKVDFFVRAKVAYMREVLAEDVGDLSGADILDVGCGIGNYHPHLLEALGSVSGVDVSSSCIDVARVRNPDVAYQTYDGIRLPYRDASFDAAYSICVMHHVPPGDWESFTREMRRVVRPGGIAVIFEHNPFNPLTRRAVSTCEFDENAVLLRARRTRLLLSRAGFRDVRSRYILALPAAGGLLHKVDRLFSRVPLGAQYYAVGRA